MLPVVKVNPAPVALGSRIVSHGEGNSENLGLIIASGGVKPAVVMRTLSRIFALVVLVGIVIVAIVSCCNLALVPNQKSFVAIGTKQGIKMTYVEWKSQGQFDKALERVCKHGGYYDLFVLMNDRAQPIHPYKPCNASLNIRTVMVTKSKVAEGAAAGESVANDPNVVMKVASAYPGDIIEVLEALKP
jgi:hypothetical protein